MSDIVSEIRSSGAEEEVRDAVNTVVTAEENSAEWHNTGSEKNTHFEIQFGEVEEEEVFVYVERLEHDVGVEIMVWVDEAYFRGVDSGHPQVSDGGSELEEFVSVLEEYVCDVLPGDHHANMSFHASAPPSVVFADQFYLE